MAVVDRFIALPVYVFLTCKCDLRRLDRLRIVKYRRDEGALFAAADREEETQGRN